MTVATRSDIPTPLGPMVADVTDGGIVRLEFADSNRGRAMAARRLGASDHPHLCRLADELARYFAGDLTDFTVPFAAAAGTPFQRSAWAYLRSIPFGQTRTYGQQAAALGSPAASRAAGGANGANPLCLLVPCHRVVGSSGSLTGFAAGVDRKRWLLDHERGVLGDLTERGRVGPGRAEPASHAADVVGGRNPCGSRGPRSPRADTARPRFNAQTLDTPSLFA